MVLLSLKKVREHFLIASDRKGMAIIMVLSSIVFVVLLAQETIFNTQIEHRSAVAELHSLRAYYAAKSGMEMNLLRVKIYLHLSKQPQLSAFRAYLDMLWKLPFHWTPSQSNSEENENSSSFIKESFMQNASYFTSITPTNSLLDINDIASPVPTLRRWTLLTLQRLIAQLRENNRDLSDQISEADISDILLNIQDWIDPNAQIGEEGTASESMRYDNRSLPPNRSLTSLEELNQVAGMTDILYQNLKPFITIHGEKGINISTVSSPELIQALHSEISLEIAQQIAQQNSELTNTMVFTKTSFLEFLNSQGLRGASYDLNEDNIEQVDNVPYLNDNAPYNFHMTSTGKSGLAEKTIVATYVDTDTLSKDFRRIMTAEIRNEKKKNSEDDTSTQSQREREKQNNRQRENENDENRTAEAAEETGVRQRPSIIYWKESS